MDHTEERKAHPAEALLPETEDYLRNTPGLKYPQALATQFPRIVNQLVAAKADPDKLKAALRELTHDHRGKRQGFPFDVLMDLQDLQEFMLGEHGTGFVMDDINKWV
ncbi:MAG TPA: hypothetical protein VFY31_05025 [Macromonas sp.]|nr:hypothetical protein [Macromonas sp.]